MIKRFLKQLNKVLVISVALITFVLPSLYLFVMIFMDNSDLTRVPFQFFPSKFYLGNFFTVFQELPVLVLLCNTLFVCAITCFISGFISIIIGYTIFKVNTKLSKCCVLFLFVLVLLPTEIFVLTWLEYVGYLNLFNTLFALTLPNLVSPFCCLIAYNEIKAIPENVWRSLSLETSSSFCICFKFVFRHCLGNFKSIFVYISMFCWESFMWPLLVNYSLDKLNLTAALTRFMNLHGTNNAVLITASLLFSIPYTILIIPTLIAKKTREDK